MRHLIKANIYVASIVVLVLGMSCMFDNHELYAQPGSGYSHWYTGSPEGLYPETSQSAVMGPQPAAVSPIKPLPQVTMSSARPAVETLAGLPEYIDTNLSGTAERLQFGNDRIELHDVQISEIIPIESATVVARVGTDVILGCELIPLLRFSAAEQLKDNIKKLPEEMRDQVTEEEKDMFIDNYCKMSAPMFLKMRIEDRAVIQDLKRQIPKEAFEQTKAKMVELYDNEELPKKIKERGCESRAEYAESLAEFGMSIEEERRLFLEQMMSMMWKQQQLVEMPEVSHDVMLDYYHEHVEDYETEAKAKWEELVVTYIPNGRNSMTESEARAKIARMGNAVKSGIPFETVAKEDSSGLTASDGGQWDWTTRGSLRSEVLDEAIFKLPVGRLSQIIKDDTGFHIIRVVERHDKTRTPFVEVQSDIRKKLAKEFHDDSMKNYVAEVMSRMPVWTIYDDQEKVENERMAEQNEGGMPFSFMR